MAADAEALFRSVLAAEYDPDTAFVCTELPKDLEKRPAVIHVHTLPGSRRFTLTTPGMVVDCFATGDTPAAARIAARQLAHAVDEFVIWQIQRHTFPGAAVGVVETVSGPAERPYTNTGLRRFGMTYRPTLRAIA
jgi:hypothetical protein